MAQEIFLVLPWGGTAIVLRTVYIYTGLGSLVRFFFFLVFFFGRGGDEGEMC